MGLRTTAGESRSRIAVIDDDAFLVAALRRMLERDGHEVRSAGNRADGVELVRRFEPHLILLDYHLGSETGASVVSDIRAFDPLCQVLLVTGHSAEQPARRLLRELDIQGYFDKADGPQRLMVLVDAALKHARTLRAVGAQRRHLRHLLDVGPEISRIQPMRDLLVTALGALGAMLRGGDGLIATTNSGLFVLGDADATISIHAGTGRFGSVTGFRDLEEGTTKLIELAIQLQAPAARDGWVLVPLVTRSGDKGCMIVEAPALPEEAEDACRLFARQVTQALENVMLYELATIDALTGLARRDFGLRRLDETMRLARRTGTPTSVALLDIDHFKHVNDTYGHAAGDLVLRAVAAATRDECRSTDVAARLGGEELLLVLPATDLAGACVVAGRIRARIAEEPVIVDGQVIRVTASFGVACAPHQSSVRPADLVEAADRALYRAKRGGRNRVCVADGDEEAGTKVA